MSSHPDADAFLRNYLRTPTDATARLVFADWLEETGRPWNAAWAYYIRLKADADRYPFGSPERDELEEQAAEYAPRVRAELAIPVGLFLGYPKSLLQLLPPANITVRLAGRTVPPDTLWIVPESVARENLVYPLQVQDRTLIAAAANPTDTNLLEKLEYILNRPVVLIGAGTADLLASINRHYGQWDGERIESILVEPSPDEPTDPIARLAELLLMDAISFGANRVRIEPRPDHLESRYRVRTAWVPRDRMPRRLGEPIAAHFARLARIGRDLERAARAGGEFRFNQHGLVYTIRATVERDPLGPVVDLDIADHFELV